MLVTLEEKSCSPEQTDLSCCQSCRCGLQWNAFSVRTELF